MTLTELNVQLQQLEQRSAKAKKDQSTSEELHRMMATLEKERTIAEEQLEKENSDVTALKSMSLSAFFAKLSGHFEEKLDQEQREVVAAKLRYEMAKDSAERMEHQIRALDQEREDIQKLHCEYEQLLGQKEEILCQSGSAVAPELIAIQRKLADCVAQRKEVDEAFYAAKHTLEKLSNMKEELESASDLGTLDMFGGGFLVTMAKHEHMDRAQSIGAEVSDALTKLRTELADVQTETLKGSITTSFLGMADFWFDGFFVDWMVQDKIHEAQRDVESIYQEVEQLSENLGARGVSLTAEYDKLKKEQKKLLDAN